MLDSGGVVRLPISSSLSTPDDGDGVGHREAGDLAGLQDLLPRDVVAGENSDRLRQLGEPDREALALDGAHAGRLHPELVRRRAVLTDA